jgi:hypothetical protein
VTALTRPHGAQGLVARLGHFLVNALVGTLVCTGPVTSVIALGWLMRRSGHLARDRFGRAEEAPGWILGPREAKGRPTGRIARALGGLAANVRAGLMALVATLSWTLPFTLLWLGAWWAGWENSFNKGYEQAFVGPFVYFVGVVLAALILPVLPLVLAHMAAEGRLSAAFELRRLRSLVAQAGWRVAALSVLVAALALPFAAARGLITTAPSWVPGLEDMPPQALAELQGWITLGLAALAFASVWLVRDLSRRAYVFAAPRAAGRHPSLWDGTEAAEAALPARPRRLIALWYGVAMAATGATGFLILAGQFLDHAWWRWVFHPLLTLPWAG